MLKTRVIPCLLLKGAGLVKTRRFKEPKYVGDPINAVKIFNDKEVDELIFLDISATKEKRKPNFKLIHDIATESFMPFAYGGGITSISDIDKLFSIGSEKVVINTSAYHNPELISEAAKRYGNQSIVVSIDVKKNLFGKYEVFIECGKKNIKRNPIDWAKHMEDLGAGEIFLNSIDNDGMQNGFDLKLITKVSQDVAVPVIASGGAWELKHLADAVNIGGASAVAAGSMFVFVGVHRAVLINYPDYIQLEKLFINK
jgi:cyclase